MMRIDHVAVLAAMLTSTAASAQQPRTAAAAETPAAPLDAAARKVVIDGTIAAITANYVFPEKVPAIARALRAMTTSGRGESVDPAAFVAAINDVLADAANDRHLRVFWSAAPQPPMKPPGAAPDPAMMARQQAMMAWRNFAIPKAEVLDGNIGYLKIDLFARAANAGPVLAAAMAFLRRTDALIYDLRDNGGGDPEMVATAVSYLLPAQTEINRFHQRGKVEDERIFTLTEVPGGRWSIDKPVYVLTGKRTASGAEEFAYDLQQLKRAMIVGEPSWGGANPGDVFPIDRHFAVFVPTGSAVNPISKTNWEGVGVKPDVAADPATALAVARRLALEHLKKTATPERAAELRAMLAAPSTP